MWKMISLKLDPRMKAALGKLAEKEFSSVSAIIKKAIDRHLQENGIDWRKEKAPKK
jgi:predicted transcriptional regulator